MINFCTFYSISIACKSNPEKLWRFWSCFASLSVRDCERGKKVHFWAYFIHFSFPVNLVILANPENIQDNLQQCSISLVRNQKISTNAKYLHLPFVGPYKYYFDFTIASIISNSFYCFHEAFYSLKDPSSMPSITDAWKSFI